MKASNKNNGFKTPEGYFEGLTDKLLSKIAEEQSVLPKEAGFKAPEGYFDTLQQNILQKIDTAEPKVIQLNPYRKYYFAAAAVAAVALVIFGINFNSTESPTFEGLADSDIENYFENNTMELSSYELAEVISFDELDINDILDNQLIDDHIIDYLDDNIDDLDELNLETDE
ncbi:hypothetical protein JQC67_15755 [Aurantibacter crassamenti]|uniref:hypothetical protein n=1 Tax=Aurantibacter crassamenti TaxID=1837375 RepID=UPI00193AC040|nr:hypothetical protein [Aurantibacter crassamenti]MBM1107611.1 hypothetical protein [Aurantibacter crassamenti]